MKYDDGLYLPTKKEPFTDGLTGATPHSGFDVKMQPADGLKQFRIKIEINHSTDFNESYPKSAQEGDDNYSGGKEGSGQAERTGQTKPIKQNDRSACDTLPDTIRTGTEQTR